MSFFHDGVQTSVISPVIPSLSKPARESFIPTFHIVWLSEQAIEKTFCLRLGLHALHPQMVDPHRRSCEHVEGAKKIKRWRTREGQRWDIFSWLEGAGPDCDWTLNLCYRYFHSSAVSHCFGSCACRHYSTGPITLPKQGLLFDYAGPPFSLFKESLVIQSNYPLFQGEAAVSASWRRRNPGFLTKASRFLSV